MIDTREFCAHCGQQIIHGFLALNSGKAAWYHKATFLARCELSAVPR